MAMHQYFNGLLMGTAVLLCGCSVFADRAAPPAGLEERVQPDAGLPASKTAGPDPDDPYYAALEPVPEPMPLRNTGSLFNPERLHSLYIERSHFKAGDIVSVQLSESTKATKKGNTQLKKSTEYNLDPIRVPGGNLEIAGREVNLGLSQDQQFQGDGSASQSNDFEGELTVTVMRVLSNDNLLVRGDKWMLINNGKEFIRLTGIIRAKDIDKDNKIKSTKIANARIEYSGTGALADSQRLGWLTEKLNNPELWPL
ncbi:flagellar basal body L-ring protein FlgH [Rheinheimera sp. YQF-2]|uniref:Flagellar L-ring protein n=1 Tax=Rheinheimera lutimaris TaxID=2740584 RepID=A0A7Y5AUL1_9GAMM|nr:flagellar basal body L-ring protein FlgH [Rheinheimera lutimaris]NRQ44334.1 flagellar basal body L-ring protein FlgH [Rheinheimera lutimaris]